MTTWNYIKGSEKDFQGAPDWAKYRDECGGDHYWSEGYEVGNKFQNINDYLPTTYEGDEVASKIIAQREPVTGINDDRLLGSLNDLPLVSEKYPKHDNINHPLRYTKGDIECIDAIKAATVGKTGIEAVDVGHIIRYLWRYEEKDGLESVKKAEWYIKHLIKELESDK